MHRTPAAATATQNSATDVKSSPVRPLHRDALIMLRMLEKPGTAHEVALRIQKSAHVVMSTNRVTHLLDHLVGCYHILRGEGGVYVRLEPGAQAVREADQAQARGAR